MYRNDNLTGLYNRTAFNESFSEIQKDPDNIGKEIHIIMAARPIAPFSPADRIRSPYLTRFLSCHRAPYAWSRITSLMPS